MSKGEQHTAQKIAYWTYGDQTRPPLLFVHGFTGSHEGFGYIVPLLEKQFYMIIPDLPGFGESPLDFEPWTVDALAKRTNQFVQELELSQPPVVVAHSLGGLVAASMLAQAPQLYATKAVFISPVATKISLIDSRKLGAILSSLHYGVGKRTGALGEKLVRSKAISRVATELIATTDDPILRKTIHAHHFKNLDYISSIDYYHQLHQDIVKKGVIDYSEQLRGLDTLIIAGERDNVTPLAGERVLATSMGARLDVIENVGHLAHYECPDEISARISSFLE